MMAHADFEYFRTLELNNVFIYYFFLLFPYPSVMPCQGTTDENELI